MNRDADLENGHVDTGEGGTNWQSSIDIYTTMCQIDS